MRSFAIVAMIAILAGCAQVFQSNLFQKVDPPPSLSTSAMSTASVSDIKQKISDPNAATTFYAQLKDDPAALTALQTNLNNQITNATTPADKVDAAQTLVLVTANGTDTSNIVNNAITQSGNLKSGGTPAAAVQALMAGKSVAEITAELTQFQTMQTAFEAMQTAATVGSTVSSTVFYGSASSATQGDLAQTALVTAASDALIRDNGGVAALAALLATNGTLTTSPNMTKVTDALNGTDVDPATNPHYAYLSAVTGIVPF